MTFRTIVLAAALSGLVVAPAIAGDAWTDIRAQLYGDAMPATAPDLIELDAPYRTHNDPRTPLGAELRAPAGEFIRKVWLIIDENPMPVAAVFDLAEPRANFHFAASMRINGPTPVRVVAETDLGHLFMEETFLKTSGVGACAAPPGTDPEVALETLGRMELHLVSGQHSGGLAASLISKATGTAMPAPSSGQDPERVAELSIRHPSHSGMQMDQITLLYIPMRYVETVEIEADGRPYFTMTGSISLSEDPALRFSLPADAARLDVRMKDTEGATFERSFPLVSG